MFHRSNGAARKGLSFSGNGRTKQAHKDECDVNKIVKRFEKTGVLAHTAATQAAYGDFSPIEYRDAVEIVMKADNAFYELPARVRARFGNDPQAFLEACENPAMRDELEALGLLDKAPVSVEPAVGGIDAGRGLATPQGGAGTVTT